MKRLILIPVLYCILILNTASMCSSDDNSTSSQNPQPVINIVTQGTWRITSYIDSGDDETNHFTGYNFTFGSGGVLTAANGANIYTGIWSVTTDDDSDDDNPSGDLDFNIAFFSPANFSDLTEDWRILEKTTAKIKLIHVSGGGGGTDYLTFEKN